MSVNLTFWCWGRNWLSAHRSNRDSLLCHTIQYQATPRPVGVVFPNAAFSTAGLAVAFTASLHCTVQIHHSICIYSQETEGFHSELLHGTLFVIINQCTVFAATVLDRQQSR